MSTPFLDISNNRHNDDTNTKLFPDLHRLNTASIKLYRQVVSLKYILNRILPSDIVIIGGKYDSLILATELNKKLTSRKNIIIIDFEYIDQQDQLISCEEFFIKNPNCMLSNRNKFYIRKNSISTIKLSDDVPISWLENQLLMQLPSNVTIYNVEQEINKEIIYKIPAKKIVLANGTSRDLVDNLAFTFEDRIFKSEKDQELVNKHKQAKQFYITFTVSEDVATYIYSRLHNSYSHNYDMHTYLHTLNFIEDNENHTVKFYITVSAYNVKASYILIPHNDRFGSYQWFINLFFQQININDIIQDNNISLKITNFSIPIQNKATTDYVELENGSKVFLFGGIRESDCYLLGQEIQKVYSCISEIDTILTAPIIPSKIVITLELALTRISPLDIVIIGGGPAGLILAKELGEKRQNANIVIVDYNHASQRNRAIACPEFFSRNPDCVLSNRYKAYRIENSISQIISSDFVPISWLENQLLMQLPSNVTFYSVEKKLDQDNIINQIPAKILILANGANHELAKNLGFNFEDRIFKLQKGQETVGTNKLAKQFLLIFTVSKEVANQIHKRLQERYSHNYSMLSYRHTVVFTENKESDTVRFEVIVSAYNVRNNHIAILFNDVSDSYQWFIDLFLLQIDIKDIIQNNNVLLEITNFSMFIQNKATTNYVELENGSKVFLFGDAKESSCYLFQEGIQKIYSHLQEISNLVEESHDREMLHSCIS